jgi:hypothetical protein
VSTEVAGIQKSLSETTASLRSGWLVSLHRNRWSGSNGITGQVHWNTHLIPGANRKAVNALDDPGWDLGTGTHPETSILRAISE